MTLRGLRLKVTLRYRSLTTLLDTLNMAQLRHNVFNELRTVMSRALVIMLERRDNLSMCLYTLPLKYLTLFPICS